MKTLLASCVICLILVATAQAVDWTNIRPIVDKVQSPINTHVSTANNGRIYGSNFATVGQFKYMAAIFLDGLYFCGGSLISDTVVLTAAQCVDGFRIFEVHVGVVDLYNDDEPGRMMVVTSNGTFHEDFGPTYIVNDIGFIRLNVSVSGPNIASIRLPSRSMASNLLVGETCRMSGWGQTEIGPAFTNDLMWADFTIITNDECREYYSSISIRDSVMCVETNGVVAPCTSDGGDPMVWIEPDGEVTLVGIVSFRPSEGCDSGLPAGLTRVTYYLDWIETNIGIPIRP